MFNRSLKNFIKRFLPPRTLAWLKAKRQGIVPVGCVRLGDLRNTAPVSRQFGVARGRPIDRYFIEDFLASRQEDIRGRVLEIGDNIYTVQFGGERVERSEVLHAVAGNPVATLVGDLVTGEGIPADAFDCMILTQTYHVIYDVRAAIAQTCRALKPGGVLLASLPGIGQISRYDMDRWGDYWRFTTLSAQRIFAEVFGKGQVTVESHGNVLLATAFLQGMACEDLPADAFAVNDPDYQLLLTVRAVKPEAGA